MKPHMKGRELESEKLQNIKDEINVSGIINRKVNVINEPTIQNGLNEDGTIKQVKVEDAIVDYGYLSSKNK